MGENDNPNLRARLNVDWRTQFDNNPMLLMGLALGGGLLLGSIVGGHRKGSRSTWSNSQKFYSGSSAAPPTDPPASYGSGVTGASHSALREQRQKATDTLEQIKSALMGFATAKVKEFVTEALPGFNLHLEEAERRHGSRQTSAQPRQAASDPGTTRTEHSAQTPYRQ